MPFGPAVEYIDPPNYYVDLSGVTNGTGVTCERFNRRMHLAYAPIGGIGGQDSWGWVDDPDLSPVSPIGEYFDPLAAGWGGFQMGPFTAQDAWLLWFSSSYLDTPVIYRAVCDFGSTAQFPSYIRFVLDQSGDYGPDGGLSTPLDPAICASWPAEIVAYAVVGAPQAVGGVSLRPNTFVDPATLPATMNLTAEALGPTGQGMGIDAFTATLTQISGTEWEGPDTGYPIFGFNHPGKLKFYADTSRYALVSQRNKCFSLINSSTQTTTNRGGFTGSESPSLWQFVVPLCWFGWDTGSENEQVRITVTV